MCSPFEKQKQFGKVGVNNGLWKVENEPDGPTCMHLENQLADVDRFSPWWCWHPRPGKEEGGGYGNQYGGTGLTEEWLLVGCLVVSYSVFKVTWPTCPWFEPAVKFNVIQYGRPVMRDRPGSLRERLARVWIRVRTHVPVGTWKVWRAMVKEAGDYRRGVHEDILSLLGFSQHWRALSGPPVWSWVYLRSDLRQLTSCQWSCWPGSKRCPVQENDARAMIWIAQVILGEEPQDCLCLWQGGVRGREQAVDQIAFKESSRNSWRCRAGWNGKVQARKAGESSCKDSARSHKGLFPLKHRNNSQKVGKGFVGCVWSVAGLSRNLS